LERAKRNQDKINMELGMKESIDDDDDDLWWY
jgi:hypothetical protein